MKLSTIIDELERLAPTSLAESWDNVGLIAGDPWQDITRALLTIDYTAEVAQERKANDCDLVIAYHPPLFHPVKKLTAGNLVFDAIRHGIAIYSPHTALDIADGGTNDVLCDIMGATKRSPIKLTAVPPTQYQLVVFVPTAAVEKVSEKLFEAGAGEIGDYRSCSFRVPGSGTFLGGKDTNPTIGQPGKLEIAAEIRLEMIVPIKGVDRIINALREAHPYEEPAFDLYPLAAPPRAVGQGRIAELDAEVDRSELIHRIKKGLGLDQVLIAGPTTGLVKRVAACAGACGNLLKDAITQGAELYLTGELRHHDALHAAGVTVVCTLHSNSERITLGRLRQRLLAALPGLPVLLSQADRDPFSIQ